MDLSIYNHYSVPIKEIRETWEEVMSNLELFTVIHYKKLHQRILQMEEFLASWRLMTEDQLARNVMFKVEDLPCPNLAMNKAAQSLPSTLSLRPSCSRFNKDTGVTGVWTNVPIPAGTR